MRNLILLLALAHPEMTYSQPAKDAIIIRQYTMHQFKCKYMYDTLSAFMGIYDDRVPIKVANIVNDKLNKSTMALWARCRKCDSESQLILLKLIK